MLLFLHPPMGEEKNGYIQGDDDDRDVRPTAASLILMCNRDDEHSSAPNSPRLSFRLWGKEYPGQAPSIGELRKILSSIVNVLRGTPTGIWRGYARAAIVLCISVVKARTRLAFRRVFGRIHARSVQSPKATA